MENIDKLKTFLKNSPDDPFLKHALALEYIKSGNSEEAKQLFTEILTADPTYIGTYYHLAKLLESQGDFESAGEWYKKGMEASAFVKDQKTFNELQAGLEDMTEQL